MRACLGKTRAGRSGFSLMENFLCHVFASKKGLRNPAELRNKTRKQIQSVKYRYLLQSIIIFMPRTARHNKSTLQEVGANLRACGFNKASFQQDTAPQTTARAEDFPHMPKQRS